MVTMELPRIYADLRNADQQGRLRLNGAGTLSDLAAQGVEFESPPVDWPWNERACFWHDPEGNLLEIYHLIDNSAKVAVPA